MAYQIEYFDACLKKSLDYVGGTLYTFLVGSNYLRAGESISTASLIPSAGQQGYGIITDRPRLTDGYDKTSPTTNFIAPNGTKNPWPWYIDARSAWFNGINRTTNNSYNLCQAGSLFTVADPIAQSFFVVGKTVVVSKVDIYFKNKDQNLPVYVDIRKNIAGVPGPEIIPFSTSIMYPELIRITDDASVPTTFIFDGLVHLEEGEYSIVIRSDSTNYEVFVSVIDEIDIQRKVKINTQQQLGSFYKSQNLSTWTPDQLTDLKFNLYRAKFDVNAIGFPHYSLHPSHFKTLQLQENPLEVYPNSKHIRVLAPGHGLKTGDNVTIDAKTFTSSTLVNNVTSISGTYIVKASTADEFIVLANASGNASVISGPTRVGGNGIQLLDSHHITFDTVYPEVSYYAATGANDYGIGAGRAIFKVLDANTRSYNFGWLNVNQETNFDTLKVVLNPTANSKVSIPDTNPIFPVMQNYDTFTIGFPMISIDDYASPLIDTKKIKFNLIKNLGDSSNFTNKHLIPQDFFTVAANSYTTSVIPISNSNSLARVFLTNGNEVSNAMTVVSGSYVTISAANSSGLYRVVSTNTNSTNANIIIASINSNTSNVFSHTPNANAQYGISIVNGRRFIDERAPSGGSSKSKYITREIKFANPSTSIYLKLDAHKPLLTDLSFYYRTKLTTDTLDITEKEWSEFPIVTIPTPTNANEYFEVETQIDNLAAFESLQVKVVFYMDDFAGLAPKVKNLRIISLA